MEMKNVDYIPFVDVLLSREGNESIERMFLNKSTWMEQYIHFCFIHSHAGLKIFSLRKSCNQWYQTKRISIAHHPVLWKITLRRFM